jgi:predicted enzyme related to lactoylglutathione lyase
MRREITTLLGLAALTWSMCVPADVTVLAVRLSAKDVGALAKFYEAAFGLKEIDRVGGQTPTEIIMRYGTSVAAAKAGASPEFLLARRDAAAGSDKMPHAVFRVTDIAETVTAAKNAGATTQGEVASVKIGNMSLKLVMLVDPDGNVLELMELPKGADHLQHP